MESGAGQCEPNSTLGGFRLVRTIYPRRGPRHQAGCHDLQNAACHAAGAAQTHTVNEEYTQPRLVVARSVGFNRS